MKADADPKLTGGGGGDGGDGGGLGGGGGEGGGLGDGGRGLGGGGGGLGGGLHPTESHWPRGIRQACSACVHGLA